MTNSTSIGMVINEFNKQSINISFSWYDYILFAAMLILSAAIGIYFGCFGSRQSTKNEYLLGGRRMKVIPIAVSLVASHTSSITLLGIPADVYRYGASYWLMAISMIIVCAVTIFVYMPVFFELRVISTYEYLERRFDTRTRLLASFIYIFIGFFYLPIVIYVPALAFSSATGINVHLIVLVTCCICIFYTTIGGLKAVVWTDTLQFTITLIAVGVTFVLGTKSAGGFLKVWSKAVDGERLDIFDFDLDPTKRDSFWIMLIGFTIHSLSHTAMDQSYIQKCLALPNYRDSALSLVYFGIGMTILKTVCVLTGLIMYAKYSDCDPFTTKLIRKKDQLLPYYVMDVTRSVPGLSGVFIAGIFSAALGTLSSSLNCVSGIIYEDFISKFLNKGTSQRTTSNILKLIVIVVGFSCMFMVFVIEHGGEIFPLTISLMGVWCGPLLGMFTIGLLFPKANAKGAFYGALGGFILTICIVLPAKYYQFQGFIKYPPKPLSTNSCNFLNETISVLSYNSVSGSATFADNESLHLNITSGTPKMSVYAPIINTSLPFQPHFIFRISHYYYALIGTVTSIVIGLIISYLTNKNDPFVDKSLVSPVVRFLLSEKSGTHDEVQYRSVDKALHTLNVSSE